MHIREYGITVCVSVILTPVVLLSFQMSGAQVMQSTNYKIQSQSLNVGGGFSSSTNYSLESTEGEVATGDLSGTTYNLHAGYQQMISNFISMTSPDTITMTPSLPGVSGGVANGSTTVTIITDSPAGYLLTISAEESPAMTKDADFIADYAPGAVPDFTFTTGNADAHFGYSPSGVDTASRFLDDGADTCSTGSTETALSCWDGLSTSDVTISQANSANTPLGATTTVYFRVGIGNAVVQAVGVYTATTTLTALPL